MLLVIGVWFPIWEFNHFNSISYLGIGKTSAFEIPLKREQGRIFQSLKWPIMAFSRFLLIKSTFGNPRPSLDVSPDEREV